MWNLWCVIVLIYALVEHLSVQSVMGLSNLRELLRLIYKSDNYNTAAELTCKAVLPLVGLEPMALLSRLISAMPTKLAVMW